MIARALRLVALPALLACCATSGAGAPAAAPSWQAAAEASYAGIEESAVALSGGRWQGEPFEGGVRPSVELVPDFRLSGDLDGDGAEEAIVLLSAQGGGSASELYLAALTQRRDGVVNLGTALVGDRVQVRAARVEGGRIELDVVQAGPSDAMCCPGEKATRGFAFEGEALIERDTRITGRLTPGDLAGVEWLLTHIAWDERAPAEPELTLVFEGERASGRGGCNRYFAQVLAGAGPGELRFGPVGATRMACPEPELALEQRYLDALAHTTRFSFLAGQLALTSQRGAGLETLRFRARPLAADAGR